jgi:ubiquitin-conjugating enzyme E2 J1
MYHGRIVLPPTYPLRPPSFRFTTPSGRFEVNREICLSISGHHEETWQPAWGVRTALVALRSFIETDARGQIGGLDTSDTVRRRLASESRNWRCPACARSNEELLAAAAERCRELGIDTEGAGPSDEVQVPEELRMGFRDEMEAAARGGGTDDAESAGLAEGFVQTAPEREPATHAPAPAAPPSQPPAARPAQGVPTPTARIPLPDPVGPQVPTPTRTTTVTTSRPTRPLDPHGGVPAWVDYAIMSLVILLVAMVMKVILGY